MAKIKLIHIFKLIEDNDVSPEELEEYLKEDYTGEEVKAFLRQLQETNQSYNEVDEDDGSDEDFYGD